VACFDTAFHQGRPKVARRFGLPDALFQQGIQRWGFHGLSYESISGKLHTIAPKLGKGRVIVGHLGSGASLCAMHKGQSVETTMSFSVLDGLPMGTRCGNLDPGVILYFLQRGMKAKEIEELLYKKSGLLGISGVSNDVRDLLKSKNSLAAEAIEYFVYRIVCEIGSLTAALGGLDGLIFTAGIGENSPVIRQRICEGLAWLNIAIDSKANQKNGQRISGKGRVPAVWVIPTDEEGVIAAHTLNVIRGRNK
jgi:acetate kinase